MLKSDITNLTDVSLQLAPDSLVPAVNIAEFTKNFSSVLIPLLEVLNSKDIRQHPLWSEIIPYQQLGYGNPDTRSEGHMLRIDGMLGADNKFRFSEMDFVPGGLGVISANLPVAKQQAFLGTVSKWLNTFDAKRFLLATGTKTTLWGENTYLAGLLQEFGLPFEQINIDHQRSLSPDDLVLRQFYRSECLHEQPAGRYLTQESWLDSKSIFALVHDSKMSGILADGLGEDNLRFLRETMPETYIYSSLREELPAWFLELIATENFDDWLMKATEVETDFCWASRSVVIGRMYRSFCRTQLKRSFLYGKSPDLDKNVGGNPILQKFHLSGDFRNIWNAMVDRSKPSQFLQLLGEELDSSIVDVPASGHVSIRLAVHFFISNSKSEVFAPEYGYLTLRQSHLAHGEKDSIEGAFQII